MEEIDIRGLQVEGRNLPSNELETVVQSFSIVIIHFLRHLNCMFCKHSVDDLKKVVEKSSNFPPIIFVHTSELDKADAFFKKHFFTGTMHISDKNQILYKKFGINKMSSGSFFLPKFLKRALALTLKGYINGKPEKEEDPTLLTGTFLYFNGKLKWSHRSELPGDEPNWNKLSLFSKKEKSPER